uniref:Uncharacterized protein n=1 Tax=Capra hircus TaxID=9925 RepID=A0A8C2PAZ6_CAPHI
MHSPSVQLVGAPGHIGEEGQGGGLPQGDTGEGGSGSSEHLDVLVEDKVVVFLKGTLEQPQRGFSNAVVQILRLHGICYYAAYNVLDDPHPPSCKCTSTASLWWAAGCCDVLPQMHQNEDLVEELKKLGIHSALLDETKDQDSK